MLMGDMATCERLPFESWGQQASCKLTKSDIIQKYSPSDI